MLSSFINCIISKSGLVFGGICICFLGYIKYLYCDIENLTGDLALKSKIGDVSLYINRDISFIFEGNKSLGDIYTNLEFNNVSQSSEYFKGEFGKKSSNKITINVKTGNIEIND